jgi:Ca-activated chloride channel family protein
MPRQDVLFEALNLYQREFKKPGFNIFVLDFSGSMQGSGYDELIEALGELMIDEKAKANFLQASDEEINIFIPFATDVQPFLQAKGNAELEALYEKIKAYTPNGGTALYEALDEALAIMEDADLSAYSPSIVLMTDGQPNGDMNFKDFNRHYLELNKDIPVFTILFGQAKEDEMGRIAQVSRAKVFDGKENLAQAFRSVRGYN